MNSSKELQFIRSVIAILRITLGVILLVTWWGNVQSGLYTADGITGLFDWLFNVNHSGPEWYRSIIGSTVLAAPGVFAIFQLIAELLLGLGLLFGGLTPIAGISAAVFFANLYLSYLGGEEWIWTYVLLTAAALVVALTRSGRAFGLDQYLLKTRGEPKPGFLY